MAVPWIKAGKTSNTKGEKTIRYESFRCQNVIESRKQAIPHANGSGYWFKTTYFVIQPDGTETERWSLADAKNLAEQLEGK